MSSHILSLFGDDPQPEQLKAVGKSRAVPKKTKEKVKEEKEKEKKEKKNPDFLDGWSGDKQYYSIGEVAALFKVATSNIRFWTKEFDMKVRTTRKGDRLYTVEQIREIRSIYHLVKERGFTIAGAKAKLKSGKKTSVQSIDLRQSLLQLRNKLLQIRNQIA